MLFVAQGSVHTTVVQWYKYMHDQDAGTTVSLKQQQQQPSQRPRGISYVRKGRAFTCLPQPDTADNDNTYHYSQ